MAFNFPNIDEDATFERLYDKTTVSEFCRKHSFARRTFYQVVQGQQGRRRDARVARRVVETLRAEGLLVEKSTDTGSANG
jgi:hypothetical protein